MNILRRLVQESKTRFYQSFANDVRRINIDGGIISISFDDVPLSALTNGVPILDRHDIKGTFYVAMGLAQGSAPSSAAENKECYLSPDDVRALDNAGHHIACHTFSHYRLDQGSAEDMEQDAARNVQLLESLLDGKPVEHFSYPFGQVSIRAKHLLSRHYKTMRSSRPGINLSHSDVYLLRAASVYAPSFDIDAIEKLVKRTVADGGWLIFYTHGVDENPDAYDCTPEQLDQVIAASKTSGARILPVSEAYRVINEATNRLPGQR